MGILTSIILVRIVLVCIGIGIQRDDVSIVFKVLVIDAIAAGPNAIELRQMIAAVTDTLYFDLVIQQVRYLFRSGRIGDLGLRFSITEDFNCEAVLRYDPLGSIPGQFDQIGAACRVDVVQLIHLIVIHCVIVRINLDHIGVSLETQTISVDRIGIFQQTAVQGLVVRIVCALDVDVPLQQLLQVCGRSQGIFGLLRVRTPNLDCAILLHIFNGVGPVRGD